MDGQESGVDRLGQLTRQVGADAVQGRALQQIARAVAAALARRLGFFPPSMVQGQRQRVDVSLGASGRTLGLLGRHVGERFPTTSPGAVREAPSARLADPEIHQLRPGLAVLGVTDRRSRLDVAVDDAAAGRRGRAPRRDKPRRSRRSSRSLRTSSRGTARPAWCRRPAAVTRQRVAVLPPRSRRG